MIRPVLLTAVAVLGIAVHPAPARAQGRSIQARGGDLVLVPPDGTVTIARAIPGHLKVVAQGQGRLLVVLIDQGPSLDGIVDRYYRFELLQPFLAEYAGEGPGAIEYYDVLGDLDGRDRSYAIVLPHGRIFLRSRGSSLPAVVPEHIAAFEIQGMAFRPTRATFQEAERQALTGTGLPRVGVGTEPSAAVSLTPAGPAAPVRVGGSIQQPTKVKDAAPVVPETARQAGIIGTVVVEITIDAEGHVSNARILRSIPLLDQAALDAVRQWEFTPTYLDGRAVPVIMTVTVPFGH